MSEAASLNNILKKLGKRVDKLGKKDGYRKPTSKRGREKKKFFEQRSTKV